jgi:hypothetical protein
MKQALQIGLIAAAFVLVGVANAEAPPAKVAKTSPAKSTIDFTVLDANTDGSVSTAEVQFVDDLRADFDALDVNHDEKLSPSEYARWTRASNTQDAMPQSPATGPSGSNGAQHMPASK